MNNEIAFPKSQLEKLIEQYNTEQNSEKVELEILYKNKKKINEKTLKKIHSYFNNKSSTIERSYILDISLLTAKNKRLSKVSENDILEKHCEFEKAHLKNDKNDFPKDYILEEKNFISSVELNSIDSKINLKTEKQIMDDIEKNIFMSSYSKINKTYRYKKRNTYQFENYKIDITLVKMSKDKHNIFLANIDKQIEEIELEIEYTSQNDLNMEVLKEMIKNMTICNQIINEGYFNINNIESSKIINEYRKILSNQTELAMDKRHFIKLGPKPVSLTKNTIIHMLDKTGSESVEGSKKISINEAYKISEKADGERYYMYIDNESKIFLINGNNNVIKTGLQLTTTTFTNSILDGELIILNKKYEYKYFDIYIRNKNNEYNKTLNKRINLMETLNNEINNEMELNETCIAYIKEGKYVRCSIKDYKNVEDFNEVKTPSEYKIDGVIFMYNDGLSHIKNTKDMSILKYKPIEQNSIDVLLLDGILYCSYIIKNRNKNKFKQDVRIRSEIMCTKPYIIDLHKKKILDKNESIEVDYDLLNNKILEIVYYPEPKNYFVLEKIRYDKTLEYLKTNSVAGLANDSTVVNDIIGHSCNPIEDEFINNLSVEKLKDLKKYITRPNSYYEDEDDSRSSSESEKQLKKINNDIKRKLINEAVTILKNNEENNIKVLEVACGRGGDISKYISTNFQDGKIYPDKLNNKGIQFILGIDIDTKNIEHIGENDIRARGRFIGMKNDYIKNEPDINDIPNIYKNNSAYFITGNLNNYDGSLTNIKDIYAQIMSDVQHNFNDEIEEDNNLDFEKRTEYELKMLEDINTVNNIKLFENEQFELISCQFAIHYLNLENFCKYINLQLKSGGIFICTFMEKEKVLKLLGDADEIEGKFWGLRKNKEEPENKIDVKFNTANNKYMTEQFMTLEVLKQELSNYGISLYSSDVESVQSDSSSIKNVKHFGDIQELKNKTDNEFEFNKLYTGVIFQKNELSIKKINKMKKIIN